SLGGGVLQQQVAGAGVVDGGVWLGQLTADASRVGVDDRRVVSFHDSVLGSHQCRQAVGDAVGRHLVRANRVLVDQQDAVAAQAHGDREAGEAPADDDDVVHRVPPFVRHAYVGRG